MFIGMITLQYTLTPLESRITDIVTYAISAIGGYNR
jgi:hypothetical protein